MRHRAVGRVALGSLVLLISAGERANAEQPRVIRTTPRPGTIVYRIERPNVKQAITDYPQVSFEPGDRITLDAGGCVQTGGRGRTWKRYVNPSGSGAELYYSGTVSIPQVIHRPQRLGGLVHQPLHVPWTAPRQGLFLRLGYQDDDYRDNGYYGHDDGTENQCRGVGAAWVTVTVGRGRSPRRFEGPRYNQLYQRSAHNSFQHTAVSFAGKVLRPAYSIYRLLDELQFRSIEFDLRYDECHWKV